MIRTGIMFRIATWVFGIAGIYGLLVVIPLYWPRPSAEPGVQTLYRYGFAGAAAATEFLYLVIATDVRRFRPLMLVGVFSKASFAIPALMLVFNGRLDRATSLAAVIDAGWGVAFLFCWLQTRGSAKPHK